MNILERRLKLLELEGLGFSRSEIVQQLAERYGCTERTVQYDFKHRGKWQPVVDELDPKASLLKVHNRTLQIYRKASFVFLQANNEAIKLGALRLMRDANMDLLNITNPKLKEEAHELFGVDEIKLSFEAPWVNKFNKVEFEATEEEDEIIKKASDIIEKRLRNPIKLH